MTLDLQTASLLLRYIMEAHYVDSLDYRVAKQAKKEYKVTETRLIQLQDLLSRMCLDVSKAMDEGTLTPFRGDYTVWLAEKNFIKPLDSEEK